MIDEIRDIRQGIDLVNTQILNSLNARASLLVKMAQVKGRGGVDYFDPVRENEMLQTILLQNAGPLNNEDVAELFKAIFRISLKFMGLADTSKLLVGNGSQNCESCLDSILNVTIVNPIFIAGPCSVEKVEYLEPVAQMLKDMDLKLIRAGAFKPRTSPYDFQGLGMDGIKILHEIATQYDLKSVTEIVDVRDVEIVIRYVDVIQIGARNMHNYELLKEVGRCDKPVLLKRGLSATMQEFILAAEYIAVAGNTKIILCERGIRTFENKTRNTLDISCIAIMKNETCLPVIVDISHSLGRKDIIIPVAKAALAAGADGLMVEVHPEPENALSDSKQQLTIPEFREFAQRLGIAQKD